MENEGEDIPRNLRTPITEAKRALYGAIEFYAEFMETLIASLSAERRKEIYPNEASVVDHRKQFIELVFRAAWRDDTTDGDGAAAAIGRTPEGKAIPENEAASSVLFSVAETIVAYAVQAMRAATDKQSEQESLAWSYANDARYWAGVLNTAWNSSASNETLKAPTENPAAALAKLRHAETYSMREDALKYWRENIDPNLSAAKAANTLLAVVPLSHKKLAELVSSAKREAAKDSSGTR
jgi:hypothetical protein